MIISSIDRLGVQRVTAKIGEAAVFDGEHSFQLSSITDGGTHFVQREQFRGLLVPLLWDSISTNTKRGFEAMNAALKERAEAEGGGSHVVHASR